MHGLIVHNKIVHSENSMNFILCFKHTQFEKKPNKIKKWYNIQIILQTYSKNKGFYLIYYVPRVLSALLPFNFDELLLTRASLVLTGLKTH